jgi:uncharacterized Zn-binding protein involved in type VI secretion
MSSHPLHVCHRCPRAVQAGTVRNCNVDGRNIVDHAEAYACPRQRFPSRGLGDTVAKLAHATGIARLVEGVSVAVTGKPCDCGRRQADLNAAAPYGNDRSA